MFEKIDHVAFVVEDLDAWTAQLEADFGLVPSGTNSAAHREAYGIDAAFFPVGESVVELVEPTTDEGWAAVQLREFGEGFFHVAYAVADLEAAMGDLAERGVGVLDDEPREGFSGRLVTLDPADTLVPTQLVEPG